MPVDYHHWTHRPKALGGTDPIDVFPSVFRALHFNDAVGNDITVGGQTDVDVTYNWWNHDSYDGTVFEPGPSVPVFGTDNVQQVGLLKSGLYVISWGVNWSTANSGLTKMTMHDDDIIFGRPEVTIHGSETGWSTTGYLVQTIARYYLLSDPFASGTWEPHIQTDVAQSSGGSKTVNEAWLEIIYWGAEV